MEAPRNVGLIQRRAGRQCAAHDLVGELQAKLFRARDLGLVRCGSIDAMHDRLGTGAAVFRLGRKIVEAHVF